MITAILQKKGRNDMQLFKETKAVSTFILVVLILCAAIFGALVSYLWVLSSYYNMPENATLLIVEDVVFPVSDARYFNVTILNPSNSVLDVNITAISLSVKEKDEVYNVTTAEPALPFLLSIGTRCTFKCLRNWSDLAGETVRVEPVTANASTKSYSYITPNVKLNVSPEFDASQSIEYFNLIVENSAEPSINLTISEIKLFALSLNVTPSLPYILPPNQTQIFRCDFNWEDLRGENATITVETSEGYESVYTTSELPSAVLYIDEVKFDYADTTYFNLTIVSSEESTVTAKLNKINLTLSDGTTITLDTVPPLDIIPIYVPPNESLTIRCNLNWTEHRDEKITVKAYTEQGFTLSGKLSTTPPAIVWEITDVTFDLDDVERFWVNVTNTPCSLQSVNVTEIRLNNNVTEITPSYWDIAAGEEKRFSCAFNWTSFKGETVTITVETADGLTIFKSKSLPSVELKILNASFNASEDGKYFNVTIGNVEESLFNVTGSRIVISLENETIYESRGVGIPIKVGENVTLIFSMNWSLFENQEVTISVYTEEGFEATAKFIVEG